MTPSITNSPGYLLQQLASHLTHQADQSLQERLGIGFSEYKILLIVEQNSKIQQRDIANSLGQTEASISRQIRLLLGKGLLITRVDTKDRRSHVTRLTPSGERMVDAAHQVFIDSNKTLFEPLSEKQRNQFQVLVERLNNN